jgi:hypothetical protein
MFGSAILDVLIGLVTVFLLMSLSATAIREAFEAAFKSRGVWLERGIRELLGDDSEQPKEGTGKNAKSVTQKFYEHPLIYSLYRGTYKSVRNRKLGRFLPTYIPAKNFSGALMDIALRGQVPSVYTTAHTQPVRTVDELRQAVRRIPGARLRHVMVTAIDDAGDDVEKVRANLETWFNGSMDRVSGWYKRRTQMWLFVIGLGLAGTLNVNTIEIANHLWKDKPARDALAKTSAKLADDAAVRKMVSDTSLTKEQAKAASDALQALNLPIGWDNLAPLPAGGSVVNYYIRIIFGIVITAFAITLGAPFWFDLLNQMMVIRSTVKPHEKSREEASQDKQPSGNTLRVTLEGAGSTGDRSAEAPAKQQPITPPPPTPSVPSDFVPHTWAFGHPDEGII